MPWFVDALNKLEFPHPAHPPLVISIGGGKQSPRDYIGASSIAHPCERKLWYDRYDPLEESYNYRLKDIFERGHIEEPRIICYINHPDMPCEFVESIAQQKLTSSCGSLAGHCDGVLKHTEDNNKPYVLEIKTMKNSLFLQLQKHGAKKNNFTYWVQCQCYMALLKIPQAILIVRNKDTEEIYDEIIPYEGEEVYQTYVQKAQRIKDASIAPMGFTINKKPAMSCKFCKYQMRCFVNEKE